MAAATDKRHVDVEVTRKDTLPTWVKVVSTVGIGTVIGYLAFNHFMESDRANQSFVQTQLIEALNENTAASTAQVVTSQQTNNLLQRVENELDDFNKATEAQGKRIERVLEYQWQRARAAE